MIAMTYAQVAELVDAHVSGACVENNLAKVGVASSSLVFRSVLF